MFGGGQAKERLDGWTLSLQIVGRNQLRTVLGSFVEAGRAGVTKGTKAPGSLDDDETKSPVGSANWRQNRRWRSYRGAGVCEPARTSQQAGEGENLKGA
jgi:hypothetical protein